MQMLDRLTAVFPAVVDDPIAVRQPFLRGDFFRHEENVRDDRRIFLRQRVGGSDVLFRDQKHMRRSLRIEIAEGENLVVLVDLIAGDLPGRDLAENTIHVSPHPAHAALDKAQAAQENLLS